MGNLVTPLSRLSLKKLESQVFLRYYLRAPISQNYLVFDPNKKYSTVSKVRQSEFQPIFSLPQKCLTTALSVIAKIPALKDPASLKEAKDGSDALQRQRGYTKEIIKNDTVLKIWQHEQKPGNRPVLFIINFKSKLNQFGGLEKRKVRIVCHAWGPHASKY